MTTDLALFGTTVNEVQDLETLLATVSETTENIENEDKSNVSMYFVIIRGSKNILSNVLPLLSCILRVNNLAKDFCTKSSFYSRESGRIKEL